jgi:hypothetical protein
LDAYTTVCLDGKEERTPVVFNNPNPFWSEEYGFEEVTADFTRIALTVWNKKADDDGDPAGKKDEPRGQVLFPRALVTSGQLEEEQWFFLSPLDPENSVSGDVRLKIAYFPPKNDIKTHTFAVNVVSARNLVPRGAGNSSSPYVVLHLLPDLRVKSTQITKVEKNNLNPIYNETFIFGVDELRNDLEMHLSVWHQGDHPANDVFMGHSSIPIGDAKAGHKTDRWYTLLPKPAHIENLNTLLDKRKRMRRSEITTKAKMFVLALQTADVEAAVNSKTKKPHKFVDVRLNSLAYCGHCSGIMWALSAQMQCKECRLNCHQKCSKFAANNCGGIPMIRLKIKYSAIPVLPMQHYENLVNIISDYEFSVATLLGRVIQEREEAAKTLVKIFDTRGKSVDLLKAVLANEVAVAPDSHTLFRANSMASKALDVYMKFVGSSHLKMVLGPIIHNIVQANKNCEVDPTRLDKKDDINANWKNLMGYIQAIVHAIFSNTSTFPSALRAVLADLQANVVKKFPNDQLVKYTAVSGFVFLRFFAPAILGPKLFGLLDDYTNARTSRTFTLLAKVLQSLSNLAEFGQKEPYMINMNPFISSKMQAMKNYIDEISTVIPVEKLDKRKSNIFAQKVDVASYPKECARLYELFVRSAEKLVEGMKPDEKMAVLRLLEEMSEISKAVEQASSQLPGNTNAARIKMSSESEEATPAQFATAEEENDIRSKTKPTYNDSVRSLSNFMPHLAPNSSDKRPLSVPTIDALQSDSRNPAMNKTAPLDSRHKPGLLSKFGTFAHERTFSFSSKKDDNTPKSPELTPKSEVPPSTSNISSNSDLAPPKDKLPPKPISPVAPRPSVSSTIGVNHDELDDLVSKLSAVQSSPTVKASPSRSSVSSSPNISKTTSAKDVSKQAALALLQQAMQSASQAGIDSIGKCSGCAQGISAGAEVINYENKMYHKDHFTCSVCEGSLLFEDKPAYINSALFCKSHNPLLKKKECAGCEQEITDVLVEAMGKTWHKECFSCTSCGIVLTTNFLVFDGMPYCKQDYLKRAGLICGVCGEYIETGKIFIRVEI